MNDEYEIIIGIDVGLNGAICFWDNAIGEILALYDTPTVDTVSKSGKKKRKLDIPKFLFLLEIPKVHGERAVVVIEDVHAFPGQGVVSVSTFMEEKGIIEGLAAALGYDLVMISPKEWQKHFGIVPPKDLKGATSKKTRALRKEWIKYNSRETAITLFPSWEQKFYHKEDHGRSDACLIAKYYSPTK